MHVSASIVAGGLLSRASLAVALAAMLCCLPPQRTVAQCPLSLNDNILANNGQLGITLEVTALKSVQLCRIKTTNFSGTATMNVQLWAHPNGLPFTRVANPAGVNDGLWFKIGEVPVTFTGPNTQVEIPVDLLQLGVMNPGQKWGFCIFTNGTIGYKTGVSPYVFTNADLRLDTQLWGVSGSTSGTTTNFSFGFYPRQFTGSIVYKEGCFVPEGMLAMGLADAAGNPLAFATIPGTAYLKYAVTYPAGASPVTGTVKLFKVGDPSPAPAFAYAFHAQKLAGTPLTGLEPVTLPAMLPPGYYRAEFVINSLNSCGNAQDSPLPSQVIMLLPPGSEPCLVWPGDANNDGIVNFGDRLALNRYISQANLRPAWLTGPARYRIDAATNPLTYYTWAAQPAVPWQTANGCYMDADGNGMVNNFDYLCMKVNFMRTHGNPRPGEYASAETFQVSQNYPNPFNPSTSLTYALPERTRMTLTVSDPLGRRVATLVDGIVDAGTHDVTFEAGGLAGGFYIATATFTGLESGLQYSKTIRMALVK